MTTWGNWTCPKCGNKWRGSIGWYNIMQDWKENFNEDIPEEEKPIGKLLIAICGCTGEGISCKQAEMMGGVCTRGPNEKSKDP